MTAHLKHTIRKPVPACKLSSINLSFLRWKRYSNLPALPPVVDAAAWLPSFIPTLCSITLCRPKAKARLLYSLASEHNRAFTQERSGGDTWKGDISVMRQRPHFGCFCYFCRQVSLWRFLVPATAEVWNAHALNPWVSNGGDDGDHLPGSEHTEECCLGSSSCGGLSWTSVSKSWQRQQFFGRPFMGILGVVSWSSV